MDDLEKLFEKDDEKLFMWSAAILAILRTTGWASGIFERGGGGDLFVVSVSGAAGELANGQWGLFGFAVIFCAYFGQTMEFAKAASTKKVKDFAQGDYRSRYKSRLVRSYASSTC